MAVVLAFLVLGEDLSGVAHVLPVLLESALLGALVFPLLYYFLVHVPLNASEEGGPTGG